MSVQFLLFVIAVLLVAIFWELCKINGQLKKASSHPSTKSEEKDTNDAVPEKNLV